jgi:hypothetical protein
MNNTVEIELPKDSLIRSLIEGKDPSIGEDSEIKGVEHTMSEEEYQQTLQEFLEFTRKQAEFNKPENKLHRKLEEMRDKRKRAMFQGLRSGFLTKTG